MMINEISGVKIPDSQLAREATQFIRDTESDLLFQHSTRVYFWGALAALPLVSELPLISPHFNLTIERSEFGPYLILMEDGP